MIRRIAPLAVGSLLTLSLPALAQSPPAPAATGEEEDLEVPASPNTVPSAAAPEPSPAVAPPSPSEPAKEAARAPSGQPAGDELDALRRELEVLRQRVAAVEATKAKSRPAQKPDAKKPAEEGPVNLERRAHSRVVPSGLKIGGYLQAQYEASQLSEDQLQQGGSPYNQNRFLVRRGRLRIDRGWEYAAATLELDANTTRGVTLGIRRAEGSLFYRGENDPSLPPLVMLSLGVTDLPFGYELMESARVRPFMERATASGAFFPTEMDVGLKLSGAVSFLRYAVALTNGEPVDTLRDRFPRDPNAAKDVTGRFGVEVKATDAISVSGGTSFTSGTGFHAGSDATKPGVVWLDDNQNSRVDDGEIQGVPATAATASENFDRWALGVDLGLSLKTSFGTTRLYGEAYAASNLDRGLYVADPVETGTDVRELGAYAAVLQDVTRWGLVGFRASYYDPNADFFDSRQGKLLPASAAILTLSPLAGFRFEDRARLLFQYDFIDDELGRDAVGVPTDAQNDQWTVRLQVDL